MTKTKQTENKSSYNRRPSYINQMGLFRFEEVTGGGGRWATGTASCMELDPGPGQGLVNG